MAESKIPIIAVVGPTASGKTSLAVELCKRYGAEAVSCDSMQIYKGMDIATAKPTIEEMQGVPHHLIGFVNPDEPFSVAKYCELAKDVISDINRRGKKTVLVGGTGLYYSSLTDNVEFLPDETDFEYREHLKKRAETEGVQVLLDELQRVDPEAATSLHINNSGRIIRALEIYHTTGKTKTMQNELSRKNPTPFKTVAICLDARNRQFLYDRINRRVDIMLESGLLDEAKQFFDSPLGSTARQAIGYKELDPYFKGEKSLDDCIENLKMQTRRYAKRQLTWFRRDERINFIYIDDYSNGQELLDAVCEVIERSADNEE
ncbi:MAG: tRNA (adenosine(37)-N6)-dimethylallyltransferase MiaA [Acutalibacteraceae bacterium]|nr:tRNA (adenosine(37)-N6)-dimethylallyltransferase MiaA [Acutalibacteraceae bacterium]